MLVYILIPVAVLIGPGIHYTNGLCTNDFEQGISSLKGWARSGKAFDNQPTYGDNLSFRKPGTKANHQGSYWIGTYENRPKPDSIPGKVQSDLPTGTLTSPPFKITGPDINFLMGGGCDQSKIRAELLINGSVVEYSTGECSEMMRRVHWSVARFKGQTAKIRLLDNSSEGWGHLNFDDLKGDIQCEDTAAGSQQPLSTGSKMSMQKTSGSPKMMEDGNAKPMILTGSQIPLSKGSKMNVQKTSGSLIMMEDGNAKPMILTGSQTPLSTGSKMSVQKTSGSPKMMEDGNAKPMLPTGSQKVASTGSKTTLSMISESPTMMEEGNAKPMLPTGSQKVASTGSKTTVSLISGSPTKKRGNKPTFILPTGSQASASTGSKTTVSLISGSPTMKRGNKPTFILPTGSQASASTGSKTTVSLISGSPTKKRGNKPPFMFPTGSQASASTGSKTTVSLISGSPTKKRGNKPTFILPTESQASASTGSKTTVSLISGSPTMKRGNKPTFMFPTGSQASASTGSKTTVSLISGSPTKKRGNKPPFMFPTGSQKVASTGSKTTVTLISGSPTKKSGNKPTFILPTESQASASTGSKTTVSLISGSPTKKSGNKPTFILPTESQASASTGSKTTVSMISGSPTKKSGNKPTFILPTESQASASTGSKTTVSLISGSPTNERGNKPTFILPTGSRSKPSTRINTVSNKTPINFSPSKRMTTTQMNTKMKSLEDLKQDNTGHSDDECEVKFIKVGCYADKQSPPRPLNDLLFTEKNQNDLQNGKHNMKRKVCRCAEEAKRRQFKVFGLQFYDECWSGKDAEKTYNVHKTSGNCFNDELKPCKDTDNECVGGPDANYVYKIRNDSTRWVRKSRNHSTNYNYDITKGVDILAMPDTKPKLHDSTNFTNNSSNKPEKGFKELVCKEFLVVLRIPVRWRDDLKNPATTYYKNARENVEIRLLKLYGEDEDFRGITFEKFRRTENRNISKLYLVLKFDNTDNYLTKLIDDFGAQNVTAAGCFTTPSAQCPGLCPSSCFPSCQSSCCMTSHQLQSPMSTPVDYTSPAYEQGYQGQPVIIYNTQPAATDPPIDQIINPPLGNPPQLPASPQGYFYTSYDPSCPNECQTTCSTMCPTNCCKSDIRNSQKRLLPKVLRGRREP